MGRCRRLGRRRDPTVHPANAQDRGLGRLERECERAVLETTVFPFILRGVALLGMDSVNVPIERRRALWERLATDLRPLDPNTSITEVTLDTLEEALDGIVAGEARGRWIVRIGEPD